MSWGLGYRTGGTEVGVLVESMCQEQLVPQRPSSRQQNGNYRGSRAVLLTSSRSWDAIKHATMHTQDSSHNTRKVKFTIMFPAMLVICNANGRTFSSHMICKMNLASFQVCSNRYNR